MTIKKALTTKWLDGTTDTVSSNYISTSCNCGTTAGTCYTTTFTYWPYNSYSPVKLTLKFSEVEYLRKLAKKDSKLKKILSNFGPHIEIEVDF